MSDAQDFSSIANISLASSARILRSSWCPDKDLLVLIVRISSKDRLSLWKMQGSKIWEVDIDMDAVEGSSSAETSIVDVAWSPDSEHYFICWCMWIDVTELNVEYRFVYCSGAPPATGYIALNTRRARRAEIGCIGWGARSGAHMVVQRA